MTSGRTAAFALPALLAAVLALAACGQDAAERSAAADNGQPGGTAAAIAADIAASRRGEPSGGALMSSPAMASGPAAPQAPPPVAPPPPAPPAREPGPGNPRSGKAFALNNCQPCHVVVASQGSAVRFATAPDFRTVANDPRTTRLTLNVWLTNPHPTMPSLRLTPAEAANVIAYIMSLRG